MKVIEALVLVGALGLIPGACTSGDKSGDDKEDVADAGEKEANEPAPPPPAPAAPPPQAPAPAPYQAEAPAPAPAPAAAAAAAPAAPAGPVFDGPKVTRYVRTVAIKIHTQPTKESEVVGWVHKGAKVDVVISGDWARLDSGHFVSSKYLVEKAP